MEKKSLLFQFAVIVAALSISTLILVMIAYFYLTSPYTGDDISRAGKMTRHLLTRQLDTPAQQQTLLKHLSSDHGEAANTQTLYSLADWSLQASTEPAQFTKVLDILAQATASQQEDLLERLHAALVDRDQFNAFKAKYEGLSHPFLSTLLKFKSTH